MSEPERLSSLLPSVVADLAARHRTRQENDDMTTEPITYTEMPELASWDVMPTPPDSSFYGHGCWPLGEDSDSVLISGHGRRALAALHAWVRSQGYDGPPSDITGYWVVLHETCGCTAEEHAEHRADEDADCSDHCKHHGLAPCAGSEPSFAWTFDLVNEGTPGAVPVTIAEWA